jgi:hypothetical protein
MITVIEMAGNVPSENKIIKDFLRSRQSKLMGLLNAQYYQRVKNEKHHKEIYKCMFGWSIFWSPELGIEGRAATVYT